MADDTRVTHSRPVFACALALLVVLGSVLPAWARASDIIVARDPGLSAAERAQVRAGAGARLERTLPVPNTEVVSVPDGQEQAALAALDADPGVRYAVPDVAVHTAAGDAMWWELNNFNDADVDAPEAWESSYEGQGVTVGVVDMGIDAGHPELLGNVESA
jgi:subtilisin family serine protease